MSNKVPRPVHRFPIDGDASAQQEVLRAVTRLGDWVKPTIRNGALECEYGNAVNVDTANRRIDILIRQKLGRHKSTADIRRNSGGHGKVHRQGQPRRRR